MRLIDADTLERDGWSLQRTYQKDKGTMVYEVKAISEIPAAQPEQRWIPCSERLPEHYDWYLVSNKETSWVALWKDGVFFSVSGYFEFSDIIAWMPLPDPYKPERKTNVDNN